MSCLGVHFALLATEVAALKRLATHAERVSYIQETLEPLYFEKHPDFLAQCDKAWDAMHRTLTDGQLNWEGGKYPFYLVVLGGELLHSEEDYILSLKSPTQVRDIAKALTTITEAEFRRRFFEIDAESYLQPLDENDFGYTWGWFEEVRKFYSKAAQADRYVLFSVDQ